MVEPLGPTRAEVRVPWGRGASLPSVRSTRVLVDDGALVVTGPAGRRTVASAADVRAVVWLDGATTARVFGSPGERFLARHNRNLRALSDDPGVPVWFASGSCAVLTDAGPVVSWLVDETAPAAGDAETKRRQSGSTAIARALGLALEPAAGADVPDRRAVRQVAVRRDATSPWVGRAVGAAVLLALVLSARAFIGFDGETAWPYAVAALLLALPVAFAAVVARARVLGLVTRAPEPAGRTVHRPAGLDADDTRQLQVGADDVVVVPGDGSETWLAGPAVAGGVASVQVVHDQVSLLDARHEVLALLPTARFAPDEAAVVSLQQAFGQVGVPVEVTAAAVGGVAPPGLGFGEGPSVESGDLSVLQPWLMWGVAPMLLVAGFAAAQDAPAVGYVVVAGAVVVLACRVWCWWTWRSWTAALRRRGVA